MMDTDDVRGWASTSTMPDYARQQMYAQLDYIDDLESQLSQSLHRENIYKQQIYDMINKSGVYPVIVADEELMDEAHQAIPRIVQNFLADISRALGRVGKGTGQESASDPQRFRQVIRRISERGWNA